MSSRSERQVKIDYVRTKQEVLNLKQQEIGQLTKKISSFHFLNPCSQAYFLAKTLNCNNSKTDRAFDLIPTLRAGPKYQLSSGSLVMKDYTQQNRWDQTQQNHDWPALESFKSNLWVLIVKKVVLSNQKTQVFHRSVAAELSKSAGSPNLSLAPLMFQALYVLFSICVCFLLFMRKEQNILLFHE